VVVVNFLNRKNEADRRVYELLSEKFQLFEGVFGASDEVLGAIGSGVDFEKRIANIYQSCRKQEENKLAFDKLQLELNFEIDEAMTSTRQKLLDHFDDEVREKLKTRDEDSRAQLNLFERLLMKVTEYELKGNAEFLSGSSFRLTTNPFPEKEGDIDTGLYELPRRSGDAHLYRLNHPLAETLLLRAKSRELNPVEMHLDYASYEGRISILEPFLNQSGWLTLSLFTVESLDQAEDHLLFAAVSDMGQALDDEVATRLLTLPSTIGTAVEPAIEVVNVLDSIKDERGQAVQRSVSERNAQFFEAEAEKLEGWADDLKVGLEREIRELDRQVKEARRATTTALTLEEKLAGQKQIKAIESLRNQKRRTLFDAQDEVDKQREEFIAQIEAKLTQRIAQHALFTIRWRLN
jgi:hypothetical protein